MRETETGWVEADIVINGQPLSFQEAMTLRVAVASMHLQLCDPEARKNIGPLVDGYVRHLESIHLKIITGVNT